MTEPRRMTGAEILALDDLERKTVFVPEWGCEVVLRELSASERDAILLEFLTAPEQDLALAIEHARTRLVATCVRDRDGHPSLPLNDADPLTEGDVRAIDRLYTVLARLNGLL